jgi:hypothetical protein
MDSFIKADIFFFVATISLSVVATIAVIAMVYIIKILRDVRHITSRARKESDSLFGDIHDLREFVKREGHRALDIKELVSGALHLFGKKKRPSRKKKSD